MVDSCFKVFRKSKCFDKNSLKSPRDSFDDSYMANNEAKIAQKNHKSSSDNENSAILRDNTIIDHHYDDDDGMNEFDECVDQSVLRPHNRGRTYHYSITSTIASNDISDEEDETLDILYPLRQNERTLIANENFDANGMTTMKLSGSLLTHFYYLLRRRCLLIINCR